MKRIFHFHSNCPSDSEHSRGKEARSLRKRRARFESLEERALLSVTSAEYADIRASYAEFDLPASIDEINIIEITADRLTSAEIRSAVDAAAATAGDDLIVVRTAEGAHTVTYASASDEIAVTLNSSEKGALAIVGYGASPLTVDASGMCRALSIGSGADVSLGNIVLTGGNSSTSVSDAGYGGGLYNAGRLTVSNLSVTGNTSSYAGGGISNTGTLRLLNSEVTDNSAAASYRASGGGIFSSGTITAENLLISGNSVSGTVAYGGGVYLWNGRFTAVGATITGNNAAEGGGFYLFGTSSRSYALSLTNSILVGNSAAASAEIARYNTKGLTAADHVLTDHTEWDTTSSLYAYDPDLPLFTNAAARLYTLTSDSQAVDVGKNAAVTTAADLSGGERIVNIIVDLGAYEYHKGAKPDITDVSLSGWSGVYDGLSHTVTLTDPYAATDTIAYTYDGETFDTPPAFTEVGTYTVSATVKREGYNDWTGNAIVTITAKPDITNVTLTGWSGVYDGLSHTVTLTDPDLATDTVVYTYNGETFDAPPAFTEVGTYAVSATVSRTGYNDWTGSAEVAVLPVSTDLVVTTNLDVVDASDGLLSLREAIAQIEAGSTEASRITFSGSVFTGGDANRITLTQGELTVKKSMTIDAAPLGENVTIDADGKSRVLKIEGESESTVSLLNLNITGGFISDSPGAGIYLVSGGLSLSHTKITRNKADVGSGGGVYISTGSLTARDSEFSANTAAIGAGVYAAGGTFTAVNCTVAANAATNYGGGVANWGTVSLTNTIVSNNFGYVNNGDWFGLAPETSLNNIIAFDAKFVTAAQFDEEANITNIDDLDLSLSSSSWGIDRGLNSAVAETTDLAGDARLAQSWAGTATVDIGAYEYQSTFTREIETAGTTVTTSLDLVDDTDGLISLREATLYADEGGTIDFAPSLSGETISLSGSALILDKPLTVDASALSEGITLDGNSKTTVMVIGGGTEAAPTVLKGITVTGGKSYDGGGILSTGYLRVVDSVLTANSGLSSSGSGPFGSALFNFRGNVSISNTTFSKNTIAGAVYSYGGTLTVSGSAFTENSGQRGGAIFLSGGTAEITDTTFTGNMANYGGAIYNNTATLSISGSTISGSGSYYGGAICNYGILTLTDSIISGNNAYFNGGGIYNFRSTLNATNTLFYSNTGGYGGAICNDGAVMTAVNCTLTANESNFGGGIFANGTADDDSQTYVITLCNTIVAANTVSQGGSGPDIHRYNENGTISGAFSLSSFTGWTNTAPNYVYHSDERLFRDPDNHDYRLASGGQAIDVGQNAFVVDVPKDLDGNTRIVHSVVDLGAYEFQRTLETPSAVVTTQQDVVDAYDGLISLREAILYVENGDVEAESITFDSYLLGKTITLNASLGALAIGESLTIDASSLRGGVQVDGGGKTGVFAVSGGSASHPVTLHNLRITGGAAENGAGVSNTGVLTLANSLVAGNTAQTHGGGILNRGELTLVNTTVTANIAAAGAGLWSEALDTENRTTLQNAILAGNTLSEGGTGNADVGCADLTGTLMAYNTLSSFSDWTNASDPDASNYVYDGELPLFADAAQSDYTLADSSQAIDRGQNAYISFSTDLAGNARVVNGIVDLGAYEYLYNADPGDTLDLAKTITFTDGAFFVREMIGNGLYGDKDVDIYAINVTDENLSQIFSFVVTASETGEPLDTLIRVFDSEGTLLGTSGGTPVLSWTPSETGRFYFAISALANNAYDPASTDDRPSGETGTYNFSVVSAERTPIESIALSETSASVGQNIAVTVQPQDAPVVYQWVRGTSPDSLENIEGATTYYYEVTTADVGCYVGVVVTGYGTAIGTLTALTEEVVPEFEKSLVVTTLSDVADASDGLVSLREAIAYAEEGETVTFAPSLSGGTITLGDYALTITKRISVDASALADGISVSAGGKHRVLMNTAGQLGETVTLTNLTIRDGIAASGGGILNTGYLALVGSTVTDCTASSYGGGIFNTLAGGASIYTSGYTILTNSAVTACSAGAGGGGIWNEMGIVATQCATIASNNASYGAGIYNYLGSCSADNTLIVSNSATYGGGVCIDQGSFFFSGTTITANSAAYGGGVYNFSPSETSPFSTEYDNAVIVGNTATRSGSDFYSDGTGTITAYNVLSSFTGWTNEDAVSFVYDPTLPLFADAGAGDFSLAENSQAIDVGDNSYASHTVDLAGNPRISHEIVDLGAYEYQFSETTPLESVTLSFDTPPAVGTVITASVLPEEAETSGSVVWTWYRGQSPEEMTLIEGAVSSTYTVAADDQECYIMVTASGTGSYTGTVSATTDVVVPPLIDPLVVTTLDDVIDAEDELVSLREAILAAGDGDVVTFAEDLAGGTITLSADLGELAITKSITVDASALCNTATLAPRLTVDAHAASGQSRRVFTVVGAAEAPLSVSIKGLKITGGRAESIVEGSLSSEADGGGIYASHANLTLDRCLVTGNNVFSKADSGTAFATGGGISLADGSLELINTTVTANSLYAYSDTGTAETLGGGIHAVGAVTITKSTISSHYASAGAGIYLESGSLTLAESSVTGNTCKISSDADDNVAAYGGGIYAAAGSVTVRTSTLRDNMVEAESVSGTANAHGGGIYVDTDATLVMEDVVLTGNTVDAITTSSTAIALGGGIFAAGTVTLVDVLVAENTVYAGGESAESAGGGIAVYGGALEATGATIASNDASAHSEGTATGAGGGIYVAAGSVTLRNTILAVNTGTDGNDLFRRSSSTAEGYYTLSSYTDWTNEGAQNFVYDEALPLFAAVYDSDYTPAADSQVINIGQNSYAYYTSGEAITVDLSGYKRIVSGIVDLGAYEFQTGELTPLDTPENLSASAAAVDAITVSWDAVENASGYELAWKLAGDDQWQARDVSALTLTLDGFSTGDVIQLKVRALGDGILYGDSAFSDALEYTLSAQVLSAPPDLDVMQQVGTTVKMMWGASPHASGYELAWKADSWSEWQTEVTLGRGMTVTSLPNGETVRFKVRALGDGNLYLNSEFSAPVDVVIESEKTPLDAPQNLSASAAAVDAITVSWDAVENASGYELAWKLAGADRWQTQSLSALTLTLGGFSTGDVIQLKVRALGDGILYNDSDFSAIEEYTLSAQVLSTPTGLDVLQQDETSATMFWGRSPNASGYELAWKADSWSEWRTEVTQARGMTVDSLPTGETVHFKVRALGDGNLYLNSEYSGIVDVVIGSETTQLAPPTILTGTLNYYVSYGANRHQIVWTDVENAAGYTLAYSEDGGATWTTVNADETSRVITGLTYGADIRYRVRALGSGNYTDSDWSAVKTFNVCPMDINGDGEISFSDRSILAAAWLSGEGNDTYRYYADINGDGDVSAADYASIRANWMKEPGDADLIYPPPKAAADAVFAEEIDDLLDVDLSVVWD